MCGGVRGNAREARAEADCRERVALIIAGFDPGLSENLLCTLDVEQLPLNVSNHEELNIFPK